MRKKIPLFTKDIDIFAHIFWVTLKAVTTATEHTVKLHCAGLCDEGSSVSNRHWRERDQSGDRATPERSQLQPQIINNDRQARCQRLSNVTSRLPVSGLTSSNKRTSPSKQHTRERHLWTNQAVEGLRKWNFLKNKVKKKKKKDDYICGQWYHTALFLWNWGEASYYYICVRLHWISGCCVYCRCRSFVRFSRGRIVRLSPRHFCTERSNTQLTETENMRS